MLKKPKYFQKITSVLTAVNLFLNTLAPVFSFLPKTVFAGTSPTITAAYSSGANTFDFSLNSPWNSENYSFYWEASNRSEIQNTTGVNPTSIYAGTCTSGGTCVPDSVEKAIIKINAGKGGGQTEKVAKWFCLNNGIISDFFNGNTSDLNLLLEEETWLNSGSCEVSASTPTPTNTPTSTPTPLAGGTSGWPRCSLNCTANDISITTLSLKNVNQSCTPGQDTSAELWVTFNNNMNTRRTCIWLVADIWVNGQIVNNDFVSNSAPYIEGSGSLEMKLTDIIWPCGSQVELKDLLIMWSPPGTTDCVASCSEANPAKCYQVATGPAVYTPLIADFTGNDVCLGIATGFTSTTTGGKTPYSSYSWDFDNNGSNELNGIYPTPTYTYPSAGTFTAKLTVVDGNAPAVTDSQIHNVNVWALPQAGFSHSDFSCPSMTIDFTNTSVAGLSNGGALTGYLWNFGDSSTSAETSPSHSYSASGDYTVTLTATDANGCQKTYSHSVHVGVCNGSLTLVKTVSNDNGGNASAANFKAYIDSSEVPWGVTQSLLAGVYTVSESSLTGYTPSGWGGDCDGNGSVTVVAGQSKTCTITNDDIGSTLKLVKSVTNDNGGQAGADDWTLTARRLCQVGDTSPTCGFSDSGDSTTFHPVTANRVYTLSESGPNGYAMGTWSCGGGSLTGNRLTLGLDEDVTCTITNDDIQPLLTVTKIVNGGSAQVSDFPLFVDQTQVVSGVQNGFDAGRYVVSETSQTGYTGTITGDCDENGNITLSVGDIKACVITNTRDTGEIRFIKEIRGGEVIHEAWTFTISGDNGSAKSGESKTLLTGPYLVTESGPEDYVLIGASGVCSFVNNLILLNVTSEGGICTVINELVAAGLTLVKTNNKTGGASAGDTVEYTLTLTNEKRRLYDGKVTDVMPFGFNYVSGSGLIRGSATDPAIVGQMLIWNLGEIAPSEAVEIKYKAVIPSWAQAASYTNIASANGEKRPGSDLVKSNFATSLVPLGQSYSYSAGVGGEVLGAVLGATLPAAGSNTDYLMIAIAFIILGISIRGFIGKKKTYEKSN